MEPGHVWTIEWQVPGSRMAKPIQQLLVCRCWLLLYDVIVRGFSSMNGKWVFVFFLAAPIITLLERQRRGHWLWQPPRTSECIPHFTSFYHDNPDVMSCHLSDVWTFPPHSTQHKDEEDIDEPLRRLRQSKKNKIDWHTEMQCRESSKDVRKLWLVICCHFIILFYLSLRFVLIHPRVHLWGGQMREAFSANLERWSFAWFRLWAPGKLRACFLLRAKSTTCYIHTRTWTDCSIHTY